MRTGVFAGSFCPVTKGHVDAIEKSAKLVDKLYVVVGVNVNKSYVIPAEARVEMLTKALAHIANVQVEQYDGMLTDFCKRVNADVMIKSVRNAVDLQSVIDLCDVNLQTWSGQTVFVVGDKAYRHISSSLVRELAEFNQDLSAYVPDCCLQDIQKYLVK